MILIHSTDASKALGTKYTSLESFSSSISFVKIVSLETNLLPLLAITFSFLYSQAQIVKLLVDANLVPIDASLMFHTFLESTVRLKVCQVYLIHFEDALWKLLEQINDEGALRLILLKQ